MLDRSISISKPLDPSISYEFKLQIAKSCYIDGLPFTAFEASKELRNSYRLLNPAVEFPSRKELSTTLLDKQYELTMSKVYKRLDSEPLLNFSIDETSNICRQRIQNVCINTRSYGAFYGFSEDIKDQTMNAEHSADWAIGAMKRLKRNRPWSELNSLVMDTCNLQRSAGQKLLEHSELKHMFLVGCDSHGIQLLIKDLLNTKFFGDVFQQAQGVVAAITNSPKQLGILREKMATYPEGVIALALSVITRWGSQVRMLRSLRKAKRALIAYFQNLPTDASDIIKSFQANIIGPSFWIFVEHALQVLEPIDEELEKGESDRSTLPDILPRWKRIYAALETETVWLPMAVVEPIFEQRYKRQINELHTMAYLINPATIGDDEIPYQAGWRSTAMEFFSRYDLDHFKAMNELNEFRAKTGRFHAECSLWKLKDSAHLFWTSAIDIAPEIAPIAQRLAATPATSVPSERAFSILNLLQNKLRNRLTVQRVDKLQFIYINERVLQRAQEKEQIDKTVLNQMLLDLEDELLGVNELDPSQ